MTKTQICGTCIWCSNGIHDPAGVGYCYSDEDYHDPDETCSFWQASLRDEPVNIPEMRLVENVKVGDVDVED